LLASKQKPSRCERERLEETFQWTSIDKRESEDKKERKERAQEKGKKKGTRFFMLVQQPVSTVTNSLHRI